MKLYKIIGIFVLLLLLFSCKKTTKSVEEKSVKDIIVLREIITENKNKVNVTMKFSEKTEDFIIISDNDEDDFALITITNNTKNDIVINKWSDFNPSIILEIRDTESNIIGNTPYSVPPANMEKFDTILKPKQNLEYVIPVFETSCCEKDKGTVSVKIHYQMNNKWFVVKSNKFYYEKKKLIW